MPAGAWGLPQERRRSLLVRPYPLQGPDALADRFVEHRRRGGRDVQRFDVTSHWQADQAVAVFAGEFAEPVFFAAQADNHLAGEVDLPRRIAFGVRAVD